MSPPCGSRCARVLRWFVRHRTLDATDALDMAGWEHGGGFTRDASVRGVLAHPGNPAGPANVRALPETVCLGLANRCRAA
jgi:hypothetical protein